MPVVSDVLFLWILVIGGSVGALLATAQRFWQLGGSLRAWINLILLRRAVEPVWWVNRDGKIKGANQSAKRIWSGGKKADLATVLAPFGQARMARLFQHLRNLDQQANNSVSLGHSGIFVVCHGSNAALVRMARAHWIAETTDAVLTASGEILRGDPTFVDLFGTTAEQFLNLAAICQAHVPTPCPVMTRYGPRVAHLVHAPTAAGLINLNLKLVRQPQRGTRSYADLETLGIPLLQIDPKGRVMTTNACAQELLGQTAKIGTPFAAMFESLGRSVDDWVAEALLGRGLRKPEILKVSGTEEEVFVQVSLSQAARDPENPQDAVALVAILTDATEHKTLEKQFVQSQKMQAIGQLAGGVAHDFNNLLTAISGHCDLLLLRHDASDSDYSDLIQIHQNANRAAALVGQLLAFSRKQTFQLEIVDMQETLSEMGHLLNRLVGEKVRLTLDQEHSFPRIRVDRRQMEQVLMNLVVNARDAMPDGGEIVLSTKTRVLSGPMCRDRVKVPVGEYLEISVRDEGCGMSPELSAKIFEPFFSTKKPGEGTGLGLSTAYGIVKQSGGYIFVDSALGEGTTFTILLPAYLHTGPMPETTTPTPSPPLGRRSGLVLLVEDETPVRAFAKRALELRGFSVLDACSGEEALDVLSDTALHVDLFVTDVIMPGLDGPSWVTKARETRPDVPVIFMSGYAQDTTSRNREQLGNARFLQKPFSLDQLVEAAQLSLPSDPVP